MRSLEASKKRWKETKRHASSFDNLKQAVKVEHDDANPCVSGLRSVCWKIFLLFQNTDVTGWSRVLADSRSAYTSLREHLLRYIDNPNEVGSALDPLDDDKNSPWNTMRQDEEIRAEIYQDVERCMPEEEYFRQLHTQRILLDVLFVFCKINQDIGYRQGMHEVLAPILWVIEQDAIGASRLEHSHRSPEDEMLAEMLDPAYVEHDAFTLLSLIMRSAKSFYELGEPEGNRKVLSGTTNLLQQQASPIVERSKRIHEFYLARLDPELATHLTRIEILPQIFLIRWVRLLFGREFPFVDLLALWDTLFAEDPDLELIDMVCVAMLLRIRWQLVEANYSTALMLLLKYPAPSPPHGAHTFVNDAIFLRDNFNAAGGAKVISQYGSDPPSMPLLDSRPGTPLAIPISPRHGFARQKSPLPSPARFLQQQGGVEGLFRGAAKGVLERGERLGINQAVRDAVGEVRQNMQGLQVSRSNSLRQDGTRWSLDEGKSVSSSRSSISAMNIRNKQLARMLDQAMGELRFVSSSKEASIKKYAEAMDIAIAKVDFVKIYLEDATIPLPPESPVIPPSSPSDETSQPQLLLPETTSDAAHSISISPITSKQITEQHDSSNTTAQTEAVSTSPSTENLVLGKSKENTKSGSPEHKEETAAHAGLLPIRPKTMPTRSTIAQSSFSWMLEPEPHLDSPSMSSPPKSSSPFLKGGRKPTSGPNREKSAFLFGEEAGESSISNSRLPLLRDDEEGFDLGTIGVREKSSKL